MSSQTPSGEVPWYPYVVWPGPGLRPEPRAQLCPVCNGRGTVAELREGYVIGTIRACHGCAGKGWVAA